MRRHREILEVVAKLNLKETPLRANPLEIQKLSKKSKYQDRSFSSSHGQHNMSLSVEPQSRIAFGNPILSPHSVSLNASMSESHQAVADIVSRLNINQNILNKKLASAQNDLNTSENSGVVLDTNSSQYYANSVKKIPTKKSFPGKNVNTQANLLTGIPETRNEEYTCVTSMTKRLKDDTEEIPSTFRGKLEEIKDEIQSVLNLAKKKSEGRKQTEEEQKVDQKESLQISAPPLPATVTQNHQSIVVVAQRPHSVTSDQQSDLNELEEKFCRICKDDDSEIKLVEPCNCKGSIAYAHSACLQKWIESKAEESALKCEICKTPYRIVNRRRLACSELKSFVEDPSNQKINIVLVIITLLSVGLLIGISWSLSHMNRIDQDVVVGVVHYFLISIFSLVIFSIILFYVKRLLLTEWVFVRAPRGTVLTMKIVSKKNHWKMIIIEDQGSVLSNRSQLEQSIAQSAE